MKEKIVGSQSLYLLFSVLVLSSATSREQMFKRYEKYCLTNMETIEDVQRESSCAELCMSREKTCTAFVHLVLPSMPYCFLSWSLGKYCDYGEPAYRAVGVCPDAYTYNPYSDTCFRFVETAMTWNDANSTCRTADEYLLTFPTAASSQWLAAYAVEMSTNNPAWNELLWIGGYDETGSNSYRWQGLLTGDVSPDSEWYIGEPNTLQEYCMGISGSLGGWLDVPCEWPLPFLCESY